MREFFLQCFKDLHALTGLRQYIEIAAHPDVEHAQKLLDQVIDGMIRVSSSFEYIPILKQQEIIKQRLIDDPDLYHLDAKMIYKWLSQKASIYFRQDAHKPIDLKDGVDFEALNPETKQLVNEFLNSLQPSFNEVQEVTQAEIDALRIEDLEEREGKKAIANKYHPNPELIIEAQKRVEYGRKYTNLHTGKILPGSPSFDEFIRMDNQKTETL